MIDKLKNDIREQLESSAMAVVPLNRFNRVCEGMYGGISLAGSVKTKGGILRLILRMVKSLSVRERGDHVIH